MIVGSVSIICGGIPLCCGKNRCGLAIAGPLSGLASVGWVINAYTAVRALKDPTHESKPIGQIAVVLTWVFVFYVALLALDHVLHCFFCFKACCEPDRKFTDEKTVLFTQSQYQTQVTIQK